MSNNDGSADATMMGFIYQRYQTIKLFLEYKNNANYKFFEEENFEDIDIIDNNNKRTIIQVKFYNSKTTETIRKNSGFFKVLLRNCHKNKINDIDKIIMLVYNSYNTEFNETIKKLFLEKKFKYISMYLLILIYKNYDDIKKSLLEQDNDNIIINNVDNVELGKYEEIKKLNINITEEKIKNYFNFNFNTIKQFYVNNKIYYYFNLFTDSKLYENYFNKFILTNAENFNIVENKIFEYIQNDDEFKKLFTNDEDKLFINLKLQLIKDIIDNKLNDLLNKKVQNLINDKKINIKNLSTEIIEQINELNTKIHKNPNQLMIEYFGHLQNKINYMNEQKEYNMIDFVKNDLENNINLIFNDNNTNKYITLHKLVTTINLLLNSNSDTTKLRIMFITYISKYNNILEYTNLRKLINYQARILNKNNDNKIFLKISTRANDYFSKIIFKNDFEKYTKELNDNKANKLKNKKLKLKTIV